VDCIDPLPFAAQPEPGCACCMSHIDTLRGKEVQRVSWWGRHVCSGERLFVRIMLAGRQELEAMGD